MARQRTKTLTCALRQSIHDKITYGSLAFAELRSLLTHYQAPAFSSQASATKSARSSICSQNQLNMATTHRRGGKHTVKNEDLTHTKYDHYTREELHVAVKEAGCYVKDDKKSVMAKKLARHDQDLQLLARKIAQEQKEKHLRIQQEVEDATRARGKRRKARANRNDSRGQRRERGEDVSSDSDGTDDDDEQDRHDVQNLTVTGGYAISDETWDDTSSDSTVRSENPPIDPHFSLRLFEWSYTTFPSPNSPRPGSEEFPSRLTYAPLKLTTTQTCEKLTLPGLNYPAGVEPDYVPIVDPLTRSAARHGHMIGLLAHSTIESASTWASRTLIQGWNARMYFKLPPCNDSKNMPLDAVYRKWNIENHQLLHPTPGTIDPKADRKRRFAQRLANKRKAAAEVYEACKWRPLAVSYMPSYLDWENGMKDAPHMDHEKTIDNLFHIRFSGCDLPHYYF